MRTVFVDHAAELLGVSRRTVYYRIKSGRLTTVRTANGTQRVVIASIEAELRETDDQRRTRGSRGTLLGGDFKGPPKATLHGGRQ